jgi:hypothetical protein
MVAQRSLLSVAMGISALVALSAAAVAVMALLQARSSWVMFGFEAVVLVAAVLGVQIGRGRSGDGPSLGLLCVAGTVAVGSAFAYIGGGRILFGVDIKMLVAARAVAAAMLVGVAACLVLARAPSSARPVFVKGALLGVAMLAVLAGVWKARGWIGGIGDVGQLAVGVVVFAVMVALLAASVHLLVKAFDSGSRDASTPGA